MAILHPFPRRKRTVKRKDVEIQQRGMTWPRTKAHELAASRKSLNPVAFVLRGVTSSDNAESYQP